MIANDCVFPDDWTVDDLMESHKSRPYNPLIANTFFRAGFVEAWGRGIQKIKDSCILAGNDIPEYKVKREDITVIFKSLYSMNTQDDTGRYLILNSVGKCDMEYIVYMLSKSCELNVCGTALFEYVVANAR